MDTPLNGSTYLITGDDYTGEWTAIARCVHYRAPRLKAGSKYRWITEDGGIEQAKHIIRFELISK